MTNISEISGFIWGIADSVLRGAYKRNEYQKVILPFTVLKRFDSVLEYSKKDVIEPILNVKAVDENGHELGFYNHSNFDFKTLNLKIILGVKRTISYLPDSLYKIAYTCRTKSKHDVILAD